MAESVNPFSAILEFIKRVGAFIVSSVLGETLRRIPDVVLVILMVYMSVGFGYMAVVIRRKRREKSPTVSHIGDGEDDVKGFSDEILFGVVYNASICVVSIAIFGFVLWPWVSGVVPVLPIWSSGVSIIGLWIGIWMHFSMKNNDFDAKSLSIRDINTDEISGRQENVYNRILFVYPVCAIALASIIVMIPRCCPYDPDSEIAMKWLASA